MGALSISAWAAGNGAGRREQLSGNGGEWPCASAKHRKGQGELDSVPRVMFSYCDVRKALCEGQGADATALCPLHLSCLACWMYHAAMRHTSPALPCFACQVGDGEDSLSLPLSECVRPGKARSLGCAAQGAQLRVPKPAPRQQHCTSAPACLQIVWRLPWGVRPCPPTCTSCTSL